MHLKHLNAIATIFLLTLSGPGHSADPAAGKAKAAMCAACHGAGGVSAVPLYPNLAGQQAAYLVKQLRAFRDGGRQDPVMAPMAKPLSDTDIDNLAAYFANLGS